MINSLKQICSQNLTREKLVLVPTLTAGQQLLQAAVRAGVKCLNLRVETVIGLCVKATKTYMYQHKLRLSSSLVTEYLILRVLRHLAREGQLTYFNKLEITSGVAEAVASAILDLKLAGVDVATLDENLCLDARKGADLKRIFAGYQAQLREQGLVDKADLLKLGAQQLFISSDTLVLVPANLDIEPLEQAVLQNMATVELDVADEVNATLNMFQAYGESNEVREVMRQLKAGAVPLDQVAIFFTASEPYTQMLFDISQRFNLPVTFGGGVELKNSRVGRYAYKLLEDVPAGNVRLKEFCEQYIGSVEGYSEGQSDLDTDAKQTLAALLREVLPVMGDEAVAGPEAVELLRGVLAGCRIGKALPRPGCVHVDGFEQGLWVRRAQTYLLGLDAGRFPGQASEDPILLDVERVRLGLPEKHLLPKQKLAVMEQVLAAQCGAVTLSYTCFDTVTNKEAFPAAWLLQVYRRATGDERKDYGDLVASLGPAKGFIPEGVALDRSEWFLQQIGSLDFGQILDQYTELKQGMAAWSARLAPGLSCYDGSVNLDPSLADPRRNHSLILSSTQLEQLGTCPFGYFLKYVLGIQPLEEELTAEVWLEPTVRGTLLHKVFEQFMLTLRQRAEVANVADHLGLLEEIAKGLLQEQRQQVPPPNETIYIETCQEILASCRVFLACEEAHASESEAVEFEVAFGPVSVTLPDGQAFQLRGKVDRVDRTPAGSYRILDYKTGSAYGYSDKAVFNGGRQLQHALYTVAYEALEQVQVTEGGYLFPTLKGEGQRFLRSQVEREKFYTIVTHLLDILATGKFVMTDKEDDCKYCGYGVICNRHVLAPVLADKVELIRGLREHE